MIALKEEEREKERGKRRPGRRNRVVVGLDTYLHFSPGGTDTQKTGSNIRGEVF